MAVGVVERGNGYQYYAVPEPSQSFVLLISTAGTERARGDCHGRQTEIWSDVASRA